MTEEIKFEINFEPIPDLDPDLAEPIPDLEPSLEPDLAEPGLAEPEKMTMTMTKTKMMTATTTEGNEGNECQVNECQVCCESYNKSNRARIVCEFGDCNYEICAKCVRTYLLSTTTDPHCMQCKKTWSDKFMAMNLPKSFIVKEFRDTRKDLLFQREISKLPESMADAEKLLMIEEEQKKARQIKVEMNLLQEKMRELAEKEAQSWGRVREIRTGTSAKKEEEVREFIAHCPNNDCRGFLSTQYKCKLCNLHTCSKCLEVIGYTKSDPHECVEASVKSAELIRKETKPCPCCGVRVFKISGCDQMWCVECHKAFSWNTGLVDNGTVHNPEFYKYQAKMNAGQVPRNPQDVVCGGLINWQGLRYITSKCIAAGLSSKVEAIHRIVAEITTMTLPRIREKVREFSDFNDVRVKYLLKRIDKDQMGTHIFRSDNLRKKNTELLNIYELLSVVGIEMFNNLRASTAADFTKETILQIAEYDNLRVYCNKQLETISGTYSQAVHLIGKDWQTVSKKCGLAKSKKESKTAAASSLATAASLDSSLSALTLDEDENDVIVL
jgi:hypothetical protein